MALYTDVQNTTGTLRATLTHMVADARNYFAKRALYKRTFNELDALNDRELNDLGIARCDIKRIAMDTAYRA